VTLFTPGKVQSNVSYFRRAGKLSANVLNSLEESQKILMLDNFRIVRDERQTKLGNAKAHPFSTNSSKDWYLKRASNETSSSCKWTQIFLTPKFITNGYPLVNTRRIIVC